jgi:hypothetical protein
MSRTSSEETSRATKLVYDFTKGGKEILPRLRAADRR